MIVDHCTRCGYEKRLHAGVELFCPIVATYRSPADYDALRGSVLYPCQTGHVLGERWEDSAGRWQSCSVCFAKVPA